MKNILNGPGNIDDEGLGYICIRFPNLESLTAASQDILDFYVRELVKLSFSNTSLSSRLA
jgi:hypothetical protein